MKYFTASVRIILFFAVFVFLPIFGRYMLDEGGSRWWIITGLPPALFILTLAIMSTIDRYKTDRLMQKYKNN